MSRWDHHPPCAGGCGELADECQCPRPNPLGSIKIRTDERGGWFWAAGQLWGDVYQWTTVYSSDGRRYDTRAQAISAGFERADASDDFNVGRIVAGELVWFGWMDEQHPVDDYAEVTTDLRSSGLNV